ncbi:discoidin domain-containing protein [Aquabacterium sp. OR-4]|uniref:discoidin domain-containing protein n=1 Tax=Aquabacterium sp. OR-4 TaxID=2978127 RepID=UPI0021B46550|nr:discoidin domain-containing protein [Aquabacterium sp. OR-4]MDT7834788.1 discoidin domain-containing protein [Aquabacterium sp. OR-4]
MSKFYKVIFFGAITLHAGHTLAAGSAAAGLPSGSYSQSQYWSGQDANSAFNGGGWNSGTFGTGWLHVDLGATKFLYSVTYTTGWTPGVTYEAIYISDAPIGQNWSSLNPVAVRNEYASYTAPVTVNFSAVSGRYFQIVANGNASWTALGDISVSTVPEPSQWMLLALGTAVLGIAARRRT